MPSHPAASLPMSGTTSTIGPAHMAEAMGTFALVFFGCGAVCAAELTGAPSHEGISLVFGLIVMAMIYAIGNVSGAHINPAVTLGFCAAGRMPWGTAPGYILAQCAGALLAATLLRVLFPGSETLGSTLPATYDLPGVARAAVIEFVFTFFLMFVILNVSTGAQEKGIMAGVAVGGTVALMALVGGPLSGASMNPARSLGPALASGQVQYLWLYLLVPTAGALAARSTCRLVQGPDCCAKQPDTPHR